MSSGWRPRPAGVGAADRLLDDSAPAVPGLRRRSGGPRRGARPWRRPAPISAGRPQGFLLGRRLDDVSALRRDAAVAARPDDWPRRDELEVVWPLHRSHYLSPMLTDEDLAMHSDPVSADDTPPPAPDAATPGRELAVRALLAGADCLQQRVSDLLGVSRRTIGRMADADSLGDVARPAGARGGADLSGGHRQPWQHGRGTRGGGRVAAAGGPGRTPGRGSPGVTPSAPRASTGGGGVAPPPRRPCASPISSRLTSPILVREHLDEPDTRERADTGSDSHGYHGLPTSAAHRPATALPVLRRMAVRAASRSRVAARRLPQAARAVFAVSARRGAAPLAARLALNREHRRRRRLTAAILVTEGR